VRRVKVWPVMGRRVIALRKTSAIFKVGNELIKLDSYVNLNKGDGPYISFCFHKSPFDLTYFYKSYKSAADFINDLCSLKSKYKVLTPALLEKMGFLTEMA
jgi:hypothetical protein